MIRMPCLSVARCVGGREKRRGTSLAAGSRVKRRLSVLSVLGLLVAIVSSAGACFDDSDCSTDADCNSADSPYVIGYCIDGACATRYERNTPTSATTGNSTPGYSSSNASSGDGLCDGHHDGVRCTATFGRIGSCQGYTCEPTPVSVADAGADASADAGTDASASSDDGGDAGDGGGA